MERDEDLGLWDRLLPASGAVFAVLMVVGSAAFAAPPGGDVSPAGQPAWLAAHRPAVIAQSYVRGLAALAFIALAVALASALRRALARRRHPPANHSLTTHRPTAHAALGPDGFGTQDPCARDIPTATMVHAGHHRPEER